MAEKFEKMNAAREAKIQEMYEKNPELRDLSKEAMHQIVNNESVQKQHSKMKSFQEKNKSLTEKSKEI